MYLWDRYPQKITAYCVILKIQSETQQTGKLGKQN